MNQIVPIIETMNQAAIWRSARRSAAGLLSVMRGLCSGRPRVLEPVHLLDLAARAAAVLNRGHSLPRLVLVVDEDWMVTWNAP
jgi:hypothetical protein